MRNVTITLEEEVARWARIRAAEHDTSVSRLVGQMLKERMLEEARYEEAMQEYLARTPQKLKPEGTQYPRREKLYERNRVR
jgi:plasmid stability protein